MGSQRGQLTATDSTIEYNDVINQAVFTVFSSQNSTFGGGALNDGIMTLLDCTFAYNSASDGAGIYNDSDSLSMFNCTVAFNTATDAGSSAGPIAGSGAGSMPIQIRALRRPGSPLRYRLCWKTQSSLKIRIPACTAVGTRIWQQPPGLHSLRAAHTT